MSFIPYARQDIDRQDIEAVIEILHSDWLTQGPTVEKFEQAVARYCGSKYAVAVNSATSALHIACMAAGLGEGDQLWTSPNTFVASANCGLYCGASVDFVDIDEQTYNICCNQLRDKLSQGKEQGMLPKVVIPVHFSGQSCNMEVIGELAKEYGFTIIEDASHAIGGKYKGKKVGCCEYSDMTVFSFHPAKIITTAEGGMVLTNKRELYEKLIQFRSHGITRNPEFMDEEPHGAWYYQQISLGYNYRMTDLQAALGISQLKRIEEFIIRRRQLVKRYNESLKDLPLILPFQHPDTDSAWHLYVIQLDSTKCTTSRQVLFDELRGFNIGVNVHYIPVHTQPYYRQLGFKIGEFPKAELYYQNAITLPLYPGLTEKEQEYIIECLHRVL